MTCIGAARAFLAAAALALGVASPAMANRLVSYPAPSKFISPSQGRVDPSDPILPLRVNVLLPDDFTRSHCWPVLYLLHGRGEVDEWANPEKGNIDQVAKGLPAIVVMPNGGHGWYMTWWNRGRRWPAWENYHLNEVVPEMEKRLPICPQRRYHAIAGLSMGGEGAVFYASQRPGYFGTAVSLSGPLAITTPLMPYILQGDGVTADDILGDPKTNRWYWLAHDPAHLVGNLEHSRVYVSVGDGKPTTPEEAQNVAYQLGEKVMNKLSRQFIDAARRVGVHTVLDVHPGIHDWANWRLGLTNAIRSGLFRHVPSHPRSWSYVTVEQHAFAWGYEFQFARPPAELERFSFSHGRLRARGSGQVRVTTPARHSFWARLPFRLPARGPRS